MRKKRLSTTKPSVAGQGSITGQTKDLEFQLHVKHEPEYQVWWTRTHFISWYYSLPDNTLWNIYICLIALMAIIWVAIKFHSSYINLMDVIYNVSYAFHVVSIGYNLVANNENPDITYWTMLRFLVDVVTYSHYVSSDANFQLICYYLRLHRPLGYLWELNDYNMKGSILGTTLKYCYICMILRVSWALIWLHVDQLERDYVKMANHRRALYGVQRENLASNDALNNAAGRFLSALYIVNKMFIPIGPSVAPANDIERITCLLVMISGCLMVTGVAVASLALVISQYMTPEEAFRARYRLIIKEMKESHIPPSQSEKVEAFYNMYWHKQKAVSNTHLLPTFPPTLPATVYTDIYFEASQKTRILRELSHQFLSEVAKKMETINYIPGDAIIKRSSKKSNIIYITYGDVEMLTAEDDSTAILRMTRGTILTPCAGCPATGCDDAHLEVRAATFCTAHILQTADLWKVALKHGRSKAQGAIILDTFNDHVEKVKRHYYAKEPEIVKHKSSILHFKRSLLALREARDANGNLLLSRTDMFLEIAGCYIMRNRTDASLTDEVDAICLRSTFPCILQPNSSLQIAWHSLVASLIVLVCFTHPYYMVFRKKVPIEFRFFDYVITIIYLLDLIVHLSTGANVEEGVPITFSQTSSQQMRSRWFALDVLGTIPIFEFVGSGHFAGINKLLRLPKVFRVLKSMEGNCVYHSNVLRFLTYTLLLVIACYLIAALQQAFMCFQSGYCQVTNFTHSPFWEHQPLDDDSVESRLTFGLYWAVSMITFTTHKNTWGPENWNNVLYTMFVLEICIVLRIFMEAVYSATIMVTTALREDYDACIGNVKSLLIRNNVDPALRQRFITYLQLCWYTDKAYSMSNKKSSIFYDLPSHVNQDILGRQRSKYILCIPFMMSVQKEELKTISSKARLFYTSPNEILINTGDITNEMYVIKKGFCEILSPETKEVIKTIGAKKHFGVFVCLLRLPAHYTVRAATHVQVFSISRKHLLNALEDPKVKDAIEFAKAQPEYQRLMQHREPFISYSPLDPPPNIEKFPLPRKHEVDAVFLHPFKRLGFLSVLRYIFPRFTIRPDGRYLNKYEWLRATFAMTSAMVFPSYAYLVLQWPGLYFVTLILDLSAYFDIFQRMLVGYFNEQGILVYHPFSTAVHYLKGAFIVDLLACLPLENLDAPRKDYFGDLDSYQVMRTTQFLMLNRLLQLYRLPSAMLAITKYIERRDIIVVIKAIPLFLALLNVLTCFMVFYSVNIYFKPDSNDWLIIPHNDSGGSWLNLFANTFRFNLTETPWNLHLTCYFWVVYETTTTGYNCFNPSNFNIMELLFGGMVIAAMIITYFSVRIISIRAKVNKALAEFQQHIKDMVVFMRRENLDKGLQKEVFNYYEYNWEKMGGCDYGNVLKLCDQITLRTDAILHIFGPTFAKCPILSHFDVPLLRIVGRAVRSKYFLRGMLIVEANDVIKNMYFLDYGDVQVRHTKEDMCTVTKLPKGSVFGNIEGAETIRCPVTFIATSKVHLLMINSKLFYEILKDFPTAKKLMETLRNSDMTNYIMGNVSDSLKSGEDKSFSFPVHMKGRREFTQHFYLKDKTIQIYLIIVCLMCVYIDVYNAGFQDNSTGIIMILYVLDLAFCLKMLRQYVLPRIVDEDYARSVVMPLRTAYFKDEFKYDVLSCLPIELFSLLSTKNQWAYFGVLRLNRILRIITVYECLKKRQERVTIDLTLNTVFAVLVWFTLFVHTASCLWYFIGVMEETAEPKTSWLYMDEGSSWCHNLYICSLYFVLTTFTQNGVGDIMPKKQSEVIFVSILQIVSTMVYMIYVGEFSNIIQYQSFRSFSFYSYFLELQEFMKNNRVSKNLVTLVNKYSLHLWRESRGMQQPHFLKIAPHCLRLKIMSAAYLHHLTRHHVFENCESAFLRQLVGCLKIYTYNENMYVVKEGEITDSMYLIHTGRVEETTEEGESPPRIYPTGSYFGVLQGLISDTPYTHSYCTLIKSQVLTLQFKDWAYLLEHFPVSREIIYKHIKGDEFDSNSGPSKYSYWPSTKKPSEDKASHILKFDKGSSPSPPPNSKADGSSTKFILPLESVPSSSKLKINKGDLSISNRIAPRSNSDNDSEKIAIAAKLQETQSHETLTSGDSIELKYDNNARSTATRLRTVTSATNSLIRKDTENSVAYIPSDIIILQDDNPAYEHLKEILNKENIELKSENSDNENTIRNEHRTKVEETEELMVTIDIAHSKSKFDDTVQTEEGKVKADAVTESVNFAPYIEQLEISDDDNTSLRSAKSNKRVVRIRYDDDDNETGTSSYKTGIDSANLPDSLISRQEIPAIDSNLTSLDSDTQVDNQSGPESDKAVHEDSKLPSATNSGSSTKEKHSQPSY